MDKVKVRLNPTNPQEGQPTFYMLVNKYWVMAPDESGAPWVSLEESLGTSLEATFPDLFPEE